MAPLLALLDPGDITRQGAAEEARRELSKAVYQAGRPGFVQRVIQWLLDQVGKLFDKVVDVAPGGLPSILVVVAVIVAVVIALRLGLGPARLRDVLTDRRRGARARTAAEYRAEAETLAARGDYKEAIRARFRAVIRELEERGVLDPRPGRTAGEIAREGGAVVPSIAADLRAVATTFDNAWYGRHEAGRTDYDVVRAADDRIRATDFAVAAAW